jgi:hypothetical protein
VNLAWDHEVSFWHIPGAPFRPFCPAGPAYKRLA